MSNDETHSDSELGLDLSATEGNDTSMDDKGLNLELDQDEDKSDPEAEKAQKRAEVAEKTARSFAARVLTGEISIEEVPEAQKYLLPRIKELAHIKPTTKPEKVKKEWDFEVMADYVALKKQIKSLSLTKEQVQTIQEEFQDSLKIGKDPYKALERARKLAGVDLSKAQAMPQFKIGDSIQAGREEEELTPEKVNSSSALDRYKRLKAKGL